MFVNVRDVCELLSGYKNKKGGRNTGGCGRLAIWKDVDSNLLTTYDRLNVFAKIFVHLNQLSLTAFNFRPFLDKQAELVMEKG